MKAKLVSSLLLVVVALVTSAESATSANMIAYAFPVSQVSHQRMEFGVGASEMTVRQVLGRPDRKLSPDVHVYNNFHAHQELASDYGCNAMVITFAKGKVVDLKFANLSAVKVIAASLKTKPANSAWQVATNK